jgi:hypothetical protein
MFYFACCLLHVVFCMLSFACCLLHVVFCIAMVFVYQVWTLGVLGNMGILRFGAVNPAIPRDVDIPSSAGFFRHSLRR